MWDPATGLVRFGARDYDAVPGRWTAKDPIGTVAGGNLYAYGEWDPVNSFDPRAGWSVSPVIGGHCSDSPWVLDS
jgi:RHS repeat-associated protein